MKLFVTGAAAVLFLTIRSTIGLRVPEDEEIKGLDVAEHGSSGYGGDPGVGPGTRAASQPATATS